MDRIFNDIEDFGDEYNLDETGNGKSSVKFENKTEATIYLIDSRKKMFESTKELDQPFLRCLECVRNAIRNKIFKFQKSVCGIILLGTEKTCNAFNFYNINIVQELKFLGADHVLKIDEIMKAVENKTFDTEFGSHKFSLGDAFWLARLLFNQRTGKLNKTLYLFTNDDNSPSGNERNEVTNAYDMCKSSIAFELIHLGSDFDVNKFYKKVILAANNYQDISVPVPVTNVQDMLKRVSKTNYRHVSLVKMPFVISEDFKIGVSTHFLVKKAKIPFKIKLSRSTNEKVTTKVQFFEAETGTLVEKDNLIKTQVVGQKNINFTPEELKSISAIGKVELRLLGFKPSSSVRLENYVKPCAFIYPDDSEYKGSSVFFTALLKRCIANQVVAICTFTPRLTSPCRFVALIAQDEFLREDKTQEWPPGFIVFFLPFAEEIRSIEEKTTKKAEPESVELAVKLIKKLKFNYKLESFQHPKLKSHWAAIEALALDLNEVENVNDSTIPNYDLVSRRTESIAKEFIESVYEDDYNPEHFSAPKKPKAQKKAEDKKKGEKETWNVEEMIRKGKGEVIPGNALRSYLASLGEGKGLSKVKKADLIEKIRSHLGLE